MPGYLIATMDVHDAEAYKGYQAQVPAFIDKHGGRFIVRGGARSALEGEWPAGRIVIVEFPDYTAARAFVEDPGYAPVAAIRRANSTSRAFIADGFPGSPGGAGFGGFLLAAITIADPETYKGYAAQVPDVIAAHGGTFLVRGGTAEGVEGGADPGRVVLAGFSDVDAVKAFYHSADYTPLAKIRQSASTGMVVALEAFTG